MVSAQMIVMMQDVREIDREGQLTKTTNPREAAE